MRLCLQAQDLHWTMIAVLDAKGKTMHMVRQESRPETLLNLLIDLLAAWGISWDNLTSIAVVRGPGSFTAIRTSLTLVNAIGFARNLPLGSCTVPIDASDAVALKKLASARTKPSSWIVPAYGAPPRITKPKGTSKRFHS